MNSIMRLYNALPSPARSLAASTHGMYLKWWRYGHRTEELVEAALARERWSPRQWEAWQHDRLARVLHRAATSVPYYREQWQRRRRAGDMASWEYLENWPVLEKDELRSCPRAFVVDDNDIRRMFHDHTSGTTGKSLDIWLDRSAVQIWYALFEARWRRWYGVTRHDRWAILGGQLVTPVLQRRPPFWVWNQALNQLYMSSYHLGPQLVSYYLDALQSYRIKYLWGYTSALNTIAQEALRLGRKDMNMAVVITNAEPVFDYQRATIEEAFQCPVRETYSTAEVVMAASECQAGRLHLWPEAGITEVLRGDQPLKADTIGELVCTGLLNADMPLIRYRVGDCGRIHSADQPCDCGRTLPGLASLEGRIDDMLWTADGRRIGRLDPVFKAHLPVIEAQIVQRALDRVTVRYVPAPDFTTAAGRSIVERLRERMGHIDVVLEEVEEIPRAANGKFRAVVCNLPSETRPTAGSDPEGGKGSSWQAKDGRHGERPERKSN